MSTYDIKEYSGAGVTWHSCADELEGIEKFIELFKIRLTLTPPKPEPEPEESDWEKMRVDITVNQDKVGQVGYFERLMDKIDELEKRISKNE